MANERVDTRPVDRLTRVAEAASKGAENHLEYRETDKLMVFVDSGGQDKGGLVLSGYDSLQEAIHNLTFHLMALLEVADSNDSPFPCPPS